METPILDRARSLMTAATIFKQTPPYVIDGGAKTTYIPLSASETQTFDRDYRRLVALQSLERDMSNLLLEDESYYLWGAGIAKASIGTNPVFGGATPGNTEIGMQLIRAITVLNPGIKSPSTPVLTWDQTYAGTGWADVFGSAANPIDLSQTGLGTSATNTQNRVMLMFSAFVNARAPPLLAEYRFHVQNIDYPVEPITWQPISDLAFARLSAPVMIPANGKFYMRGNIQQPNGATSLSDATELFGMVFATGDYLTFET